MIYIVIGIISGIVTALGMGGGSILITILTGFMGINQKIAQSCNIIFFIPTSIVAIIVNIKNKNIDLKLATIISIFGILGAIIGAKLSVHTDVKMLRKYFGIFLAIIALHEIYTIIKENKKTKLRENK